MDHPLRDRTFTAPETEPEGRHTDLVLDETLLGIARSGWRDPAAIDADARAFRSDLGLPADRPIVMTGHQAQFWHAGILAKYLAADALAHRDAYHQATNSDPSPAVVWCVPDHVAEAPGVVGFPKPGGDGGPGRWTRASVDLFTDDLPVEAPRGLAVAQAELRDAPGEREADRQIAAQASLLERRLGLRTDGPIVLASRLHHTGLFRALVGRMRAEPDACVRAYNGAVRATPDAGVRSLADAADRTELPLWRIDDRGSPHAVLLDDLDETPIDRIRPRALLFTGLLRACACDLFIHGTGGGVYDRVTERWLADWLGWSLAPAGIATATLTLDLGVPDVTRTDLRDAKWRAHNARHNPGVLGDAADLDALQERKRALVERIAKTPRGERDPLYAEMHAMLAGVRGAHADGIASLDARVGMVEAALADRAIARDRTWAWILHEDADLRALAADIRGRLGAMTR